MLKRIFAIFLVAALAGPVPVR
ncbi:MAG TPA: TIGR02301 family protein, partial [Afipia sp.]|nr:TIGR02301 family protein [Afipia sp.]